MKIAIDAMGGDHAPYEVVKGTILAANSRNDIQIILIGDKEIISNVLLEFDISLPQNVEIFHTDRFITMKDDERLDGSGYPIQRYTVHILPPIYPDESLGEKVGAEKLRAEGMDGGNVRRRHFGKLFFKESAPLGRDIACVDLLDERLAQLFLHLRRRFFRKRHCQDLAHASARFDKANDFFNHDRRFTAARGSGHERFALRLNRRLLF